MICQCKLGPDNMGCESGCLNRTACIECDARHCPCGPGCQNQRCAPQTVSVAAAAHASERVPLPARCRFQRRENAKLDMMRAGKKGYGLRTLQDLKKGQFIIEYVGCAPFSL